MKFAANASAPRRIVYATREVIVAAGALHSVQLLQLSGIGPASLLNQFQIPLALDMPGVGRNLQDHCLVGTFYPCKSPQNQHSLLVEAPVANPHKTTTVLFLPQWN